MSTVSAGQSVQLRIGAFDGLWVNCSGVGFVDFECKSRGTIQLSAQYQRIGFYGEEICVELRCISGVIDYSTTPVAIEPLTAKQAGDNNDSSPLDLKLNINGLQNGALGFDAITLKGLPQTLGAPAGYGDLARAINLGAGFANISAFGVTSGNSEDQRQKIQDCIDYAFDNTLLVNFDVDIVRIDGTLFFKDVEVRGNGVWLLNYGSTDAISVHPDFEFIKSRVSGINVTYKDHLSPINPYVPSFTVDRNLDPYKSMTWDHFSLFTASGFSHGVNGGFFRDLNDCQVYLHYRGFYVAGWSANLSNIRAVACFNGFENNNNAIGGTVYPFNASVLIGCDFVANQNRGVSLTGANQVDLNSLNCEKNRSQNIVLTDCKSVSGSVYTEYSDGIRSDRSSGITLNCFSLGMRAQFVAYFKEIQSIYELPATGATPSITVPTYNAGTGFGIDGFAAMPDTDVVVMKNYKFLPRSGWSKSGAVITLTTPGVSGDLFHVTSASYVDWSPTSSRIEPKMLTGGEYFLNLSHTYSSTFNGYSSAYAAASHIVNDYNGGLPITSNVLINSLIEFTPIDRNSTRVIYALRDGIYYNQAFFGGISVRNALDTNANAQINSVVYYPPIGVSSNTITNIHRYVLMLLSADGSALFTVDQAGGINAIGASSNKITCQTTDAAASGKLNIYSGTANTIRWNNLLGYATQVTLIRFFV